MATSPFDAGKVEFIRTVSEIEVLATDKASAEKVLLELGEV
jgi:signal recognition particle receptor subunit beta